MARARGRGRQSVTTGHPLNNQHVFCDYSLCTKRQCEQVKQYGSSYCRSKKRCDPPTRFEIGQYVWPFYPDLPTLATNPKLSWEKKQYTRSNPYWEKRRKEGKFDHSFRKQDGLPYMTPYLGFASCMSSSEEDRSTPQNFPGPGSRCTQRRRLGVGSLRDSAYDMPNVDSKVREIKTWNATIAAALSTCEPLCAAA